MLSYVISWLTTRLGRRGVTAMEYGLIAALIAVVIIGTVTQIGTGLVTKFQAIVDAINGAGGTG